MARWSRTVSGVLGSFMIVAALAAPGTAAVFPKPLPKQWWFTTWGVQNMLWPITQGSGVVVAVIDSGVQADIPDLEGAVLPGMDSEGGDGRIDKDSEKVAGHGTGMAAHIVSQGKGTGFLGVAPKAKVLPITATRTSSGLSMEIRYAVDHGAKVINISQVAKGPCFADLQRAVAYAVERDVVIVAGAGNTGDEDNPSYHPANCAGVLAVGAVDVKFKPWVKTQRQPYVTVAAPGLDVGSVLKDGKFHTSSGGTSGATALTSAAVALVRSKYPQMPAREVVHRFIASCLDVGPKGKDDQTGYGLVRPYRALTQAPSASTPNPVFDAYDKLAQENGKAGAGNQSNPQAAPGGSSGSGKLLLVAGAAVVVVLLIIVVIVIRGRGNRAQPPMPPGPGHPYAQGPPAQFSPPNQSSSPWSHNG